jgi:2-phosphosulfolactate phosphatase
MNYFNQSEYDIRCEWAMEGVNLLGPTSDVLIIVDVFSFSTCVDIATSRGARVFLFQWRDDRLTEFAASVNALPAIASRTDPVGLSLAPSSMLRIKPGTSIVLPSPNGANLSLAAGAHRPVFTGCVRNARAVAAAARQLGRQVSIIPAGERWPDGRLRPALEDLIGAGAIIHHLPGSRSPEAQAAEAVFRHFQANLLVTLQTTGSGVEAEARGTQLDVELAAEYGASEGAPRLVDGAFVIK